MMLPGQIRMHWPHRMHRARKRSSSKAPGGRMRPASRPAPASPPTPHTEARSSPDPATIKPRRDRSGNPASPAAEGLPAKVTRPAGQRSRQFMHMTHSPVMMVPDGRQAPSQYSSPTQQSPPLPAGSLVDRAQGAGKAAEEPAHQQGQADDHQGPDESVIKRAGGQDRG